MFVTLRGGLNRLVDALAGALQDGEVRTSCAVTAIQPEPGGGFWITAQDGQRTFADALIMASPASASAGLTAPFAPELSRGLAGIRYVSTATVSLAYRAPIGTPRSRALVLSLPGARSGASRPAR